MEDSYKESEINEILEYNGNEEEFIQDRKNLIQQINSISTSNEQENKIRKFKKDMIDNNYEGIGILYNENGSKIYTGYFKNGKYNGFGKLYEPVRGLIYEGFFKDNKYNGKGILYEIGKKIYEGNFENGNYENIGIEYLPNGKRKRKAKFHLGKILDECYGILYGKNDDELYKGILKKGIPKEGKTIIIYSDDNYIIYKGDFLSFKYNGNGTLYFEKTDKILFNGTFKDDKYLNGILYYFDGNKKYEGEFNDNLYNGKGIIYYEKDNKIFCKGIFNNGNFISGESYSPEGIILYKGEFTNYLPKKGKNIKSYELNGYLKYKGDFENFNYHGHGKLYITKLSNPLLYEGDFKFGLFEGNGILYEKDYKKYEGSFSKGKLNGNGKIYEIDDKNNHYLYYEGNFVDAKICGKGVKYYVNGAKKIEGIFQNINSYEGKYYNPQNKEIFNGKISNEIPMDFENMILYNDLGNIVYDSRIYNGEYYKERIINCNNDIKNNIMRYIVTFLSCGSPPGKTCLIYRITMDKFSLFTLVTMGIDSSDFNYEFNGKKYKIKLTDTAGPKRFRSISLNYAKKSDIIVYLFDFSEDDSIKEDFIQNIKDVANKETLIYLVGNKLDLIDFQEEIEEFRLKAKNLIDRGKIDKYFELSAKTGIGIDLFLKYLKIDGAIINENKYDSTKENPKTSKERKHKKCLIF